MSRFTEELRIIPKTAWAFAILIYLGSSTMLFIVALPSDPNMRHWPLLGQIAFCYGMMLLIFALVLLDGYVYGDAKRRGMRYVMWTWLAVLVPDGIGIILYFILRDPMPSPCPKCAATIPAKYPFCPQCGTPIKMTCPRCGKPVERAWTNCAFCGIKLPGSSSDAAA